MGIDSLFQEAPMVLNLYAMLYSYVPLNMVYNVLGDLNFLGHLGHSLCRSHGSIQVKQKSMIDLCLQYSMVGR